MKARVLATFTDGELKAIHEEGKIIELTQKRFNEINKINDKLLEEHKEDKED
ncbi:hypothetical protein [Clostridium beijerinckii]|uniref:hypothetical protein n=1 Tax=Clostridium beijerinckii TaxID=1520 RepID=UPI00232FB107|nr:hypothetical protein [Clostridium beijerinckii]